MPSVPAWRTVVAAAAAATTFRVTPASRSTAAAVPREEMEQFLGGLQDPFLVARSSSLLGLVRFLLIKVVPEVERSPLLLHRTSKFVLDGFCEAPPDLCRRRLCHSGSQVHSVAPFLSVATIYCIILQGLFMVMTKYLRKTQYSVKSAFKLYLNRNEIYYQMEGEC